EVEVSKEKNPAQADNSKVIEITVIDKGPVIRAEASAADQYSALDLASGKLFERLRRSRDRRKSHRRVVEKVGEPLTLTAEEL
ncbi:HPF/RaiA family ribosome-associated protein, partial [Streptococcus anginosus]|nr:HPF/RaiA family ribosome-associated protein [Streptococcus anginosus]